MCDLEADRAPTEAEVLDALLAVVRTETISYLRGHASTVALEDDEGVAVRACVLTMVLLVRRHLER